MTAFVLPASGRVVSPVLRTEQPVLRTEQPVPIAFGAILADCPWRFRVYNRATGLKRTADSHYPTMELDAIKALPVHRLAARDCVLFLWATMPMLPEAFAVMNAWGFSYRTVAFTWTKLNKRGVGYFTGLGHYTRANAELCLLGVRGKPKRRAKDVKQLIVAPVREHSRKPDETHERVERLVDGPYIELFARQQRPGWQVWGNAVACSPYANAVLGTGQKLLPAPHVG